MTLLLILASLACGQVSTEPVKTDGVDAMRTRMIQQDIRELQQGRPTITGLPYFRGGIGSSTFTVVEGSVTVQTGGNEVCIGTGTSACGTYSLKVETDGDILAAAPIVLSSAAPATPQANAFYTDSMVKAWVNFAGGASPSITGDFNVSSVGYNSTGDYTVNFATSISSKYAIAGSGMKTGLGFTPLNPQNASALGTGSVRITTNLVSDGSAQDPSLVMLVVVGAN